MLQCLFLVCVFLVRRATHVTLLNENCISHRCCSQCNAKIHRMHGWDYRFIVILCFPLTRCMRCQLCAVAGAPLHVTTKEIIFYFCCDRRIQWLAASFLKPKWLHFVSGDLKWWVRLSFWCLKSQRDFTSTYSPS